MAADDSPAGARRRLRLALRKAREVAGLTQGDVGDALHWSLSKVQRIESGDVTISVTDLAALLRLLEVTDADQVDRMTNDARLARKRGWWDRAPYRDYLTPALSKVVQYELTASEIRVFQFAVFPGLLQDEKYADAIFTVVEHASAEVRRTKLEIRMRRKEGVWGREEPPRYLVILDEFLLERSFSDPSVAVRQFEVLLTLIRQRPEVIVRLLPKEQARFLLLGAFSIYSFGDEEDAALYREFSITDEIVHDTVEVGKYRLRFEQMWELCLSPAATMDVVEAQYAHFRALLSRRG
ncbi:helix-turn-helix domain-containing protein [Dactylosporangium sp. CS-047395]|uniref:helix-turn-helix domain-containing protein n=1 Tax=Dactylosporangium sp. CS-047395 TaxID=3239936 RepID=UPI003D9465F6